MVIAILKGGASGSWNVSAFYFLIAIDINSNAYYEQCGDCSGTAMLSGPSGILLYIQYSRGWTELSSPQLPWDSTLSPRSLSVPTKDTLQSSAAHIWSQMSYVVSATSTPTSLSPTQPASDSTLSWSKSALSLWKPVTASSLKFHSVSPHMAAKWKFYLWLIILLPCLKSPIALGAKPKCFSLSIVRTLLWDPHSTNLSLNSRGSVLTWNAW